MNEENTLLRGERFQKKNRLEEEMHHFIHCEGDLVQKERKNLCMSRKKCNFALAIAKDDQHAFNHIDVE